MFIRIQLQQAGEDRDSATYVGVMDNSVERFGRVGAGPQQCRKFLEQWLYLVRASWCYKRRITCIGESAA